MAKTNTSQKKIINANNILVGAINEIIRRDLFIDLLELNAKGEIEEIEITIAKHRDFF